MKYFNFNSWIYGLLILITPYKALAEVANLQKCSDSTAFIKRQKASVKKLEQRLSTYKLDSPSALALQQQIDKTNSRFEKYSRSDLLCGTDGLPHLIADGRWDHAAEFIVPGVGFLYISGWIGYVGRKYLRAISVTKNPAESEIVINVPLALEIMATGYIWPISIWQELIHDELIALTDGVTVSPR